MTPRDVAAEVGSDDDPAPIDPGLLPPGTLPRRATTSAPGATSHRC